MKKKVYNDILFAEQSPTIQWKLSIVSAAAKILLGISEASLAPEARLLVKPMLPINSSTVGGPAICKHIIFVVQNQLCLAEAVHRFLYPPGSWWDRASQMFKHKTGSRRQSFLFSPFLWVSEPSRPSHAKLYCRSAEWCHSCTCQWWNQQDSAPS